MKKHYLYIYIYIKFTEASHHNTLNILKVVVCSTISILTKAACCLNIEIVLHTTTLSIYIYIYIYTYIYIYSQRVSDFLFVSLRPFFYAALAKRWKVQFRQG